MLALDGFLRRRRRVVLAAWVLAFVVALPFAARQSDNLTGGGFADPSSMSRAVENALERDFARGERANLAGVLVLREGAGEQDYRAALTRLREGVGRTADVGLDDAALRAAQVPGERRAVVVALDVAVGETMAPDVARELNEELGIGEEDSGARVTTHLIGQGALWAGLQKLSKEDLEAAEAIGFPIVALILLAVFGSLAVASLPLALGFVSVLITGALIWLLSRSMEMSVYTTNMASMIGIGVAVDYSLFVLARYREELQAGRDKVEARAAALATSGVAVVFSGLTVIASLAGLLLIDTTALRSMAIGAILVVAVSMLAATTLLPLLLALLGDRAQGRGRVIARIAAAGGAVRRRVRGAGPGRGSREPFWARWTARVMRRPVVSALGAATVLLVFAIPALSLKTGDGALRQFPPGYQERVGFEAAAAEAGPGALTPVNVLVGLRGASVADREGLRALGDVRAALARDPQIAGIGAPQPSRDARSALLVATPRGDGESEATKALVERLRDTLPGAAPGADVSVGGSTAGLLDFNALVSGSLWKIVLFVLALSYLVLMVLLRSAVLPLKAVVLNLLSVGAAYGVVVAVFQWGWADGLFGFESPGYVDTITPPLILAVVFGLSMDYEVFLLTRIRERFGATGDTRAAVSEGLATSARTITSAALIMIAVFATFVGTGVPSVQQIGLGNAVAIAVDATIVRLVLVPASMTLLGRWNWWLPRPLERLLPHTDFEQLQPVGAGASAALPVSAAMAAGTPSRAVG